MSTPTHSWLSMRVDNQWFALPLSVLGGVLDMRPLIPVPAAPPVVAGAAVLRGGVALALDMRRELGLPPHPQPEQAMLVRFDEAGESFLLVVDAVGDLFSVETGEARPVPMHLDAAWRRLGAGLVMREDGLVLLLDPARLAAPRTA